MSKQVPANRILSYEAVGFFLIIAVFWLLVFQSALVLTAALILTAAVLSIAAPVIILSARAMRQAGSSAAAGASGDDILICCSWCKKIKQDKEWITLDEFYNERFENVTSHGICQTCLTDVEKRLPQKTPKKVA